MKQASLRYIGRNGDCNSYAFLLYDEWYGGTFQMGQFFPDILTSIELKD